MRAQPDNGASRWNDGTGASERLADMSDVAGIIATRHRKKADRPTVLAFVLDNESQGLPRAGTGANTPLHPSYPVTVASWSAPAAARLQELQALFGQRQPRVSLPATSLRTRLEIADERILRLDRNLGTYGLAAFSHTMLWTETSAEDSRTRLNDAVLGWLSNEVSRLAHEDTEVIAYVEQLQRLARAKSAIEARQRIAQPYQWEMTQSWTAKGSAPESYADLADFVARRLEGRVIFPDLPGVRRVISGDLTSGIAELMTDPFPVAVRRDRNGAAQNAWCSLVVRIQVFSYPGRPGPVVAIEFSRRTWTRELKARSSVRRLSAFAFPGGSSRALRFTVLHQRTDAGGSAYAPDADFAPIARRYVEGETPSVSTMLKTGPYLEGCRLVISAKTGIAERSAVKTGVPDRDKADAFDAIAMHLSTVGLTPWRGVQRIETLARRATGRNEGWRKRGDTAGDGTKRYAEWREEAQAHILSCYAGVHEVIVAVQRDADAEDSAIEAERRLHDILGDAVRITRVPIPSDTHGPRNSLPGRNQTTSKRAALRQQAWAPFLATVKQHLEKTGRRIDGILVIAKEWYPGPAHDDVINQRAARTALITGLGAPVQYLRPREHISGVKAPSKPSGANGDALMTDHEEQQAQRREQRQQKQRGKVDEDFERRLMNAWLDLAFTSQGLLRQEQLRSEAHGIWTEQLPDRILALSVVRRNTTRRVGNDRSIIPCAIELDIETGRCLASFAFEDPATRTLAWSDPQPLPQALVTLARLGPSPLSSAKSDRQRILGERAQTFFKQRLADFCQRSARPLVLIDADTCRSLWPWLQDTRLDPENVQLAGSYNAQVAWLHAKVARIRTGNGPKVLWDQTYSGETIDMHQQVRYRGPVWAEAQLFGLTDTHGTHVYLSFGSTSRHGRRQGTSGYRRLLGIVQTRGTAKENGPYQATIMEPYTDAWATPTGVEIVVVRPGDDDPDQVAVLLEWLRQCYAHFGDWSEKPAPLHFDRVLKSYVADFDLDDEDDADIHGATEAPEWAHKS